MGQRWMDGSWDAHLASPAHFFAGADDITKERERAWDRDHRTHSLIFDNYYYYSTIVLFHQIRSRERAKYTTVIHSVVSRFDRFATERIRIKTFHWLSVVFTSFARAIFWWTGNAGCILTLLLEKNKKKPKIKKWNKSLNRWFYI